MEEELICGICTENISNKTKITFLCCKRDVCYTCATMWDKKVIADCPFCGLTWYDSSHWCWGKECKGECGLKNVTTDDIFGKRSIYNPVWLEMECASMRDMLEQDYEHTPLIPHSVDNSPDKILGETTESEETDSTKESSLSQIFTMLNLMGITTLIIIIMVLKTIQIFISHVRNLFCLYFL